MMNSGSTPTSSLNRTAPRADRDRPLPRMAAPTAARRRRAAGRTRRPDEADRIATAPTAATVRELLRLHAALAGRGSLVPSPEVDALFGRLVGIVVGLDPAAGRAVVADPLIRAVRAPLQRLCAIGETELERAWSARITAAADPAAELERFPYAENYRRLSELEWSAVLGAGDGPPRRIAFVGAGPLPVSALLLARQTGVAVDAFDRDPGAAALARELAAALGPAGLRIRLGDTAERPDLRAYDVVVLAALVGATPQAKRAAVADVRAGMRPGALLAARSAHGARTLLYPVLDLGALAGFDLLNVVHPFDEVVNSVVLARRRGDPEPETDAWATTPTRTD